MKKPNFKKVGKVLSDHSSEICTAAGIVGLITTAVLTGRASARSVRLIDEAEMKKKEPLTKKEVVECTWKEFIAPVATGGASIACILTAQKANAKQKAALIGALQVTQTAFSEYKDEVLKTIGDKKVASINKSLNEKALAEKEPPKETQVIITSDDNQLCFDKFSGRYFYSSAVKIKDAEQRINDILLSDGYASVNDFWSELHAPGLEASDIGYLNGWNIDNGLISIEYSSHITRDGRPALVVTFTNEPKVRYNMFG